MPGMVLWVSGIVASIVALVLTAAAKMYYVHMFVAALVSLGFALLAFRGGRAGDGEPGATSALAASHIRHMGLVWTWGALCMMAMYGTQILTWREWPQFLVALTLLAAVCLFVGQSVAKDAVARRDDGSILGLARILVLVQLVAMPIVMIGLLVDGKMWRFTTAAGQRANWQDWGANNVFFFGALAITALAWNAWSVLRARTAG